MSSYITVLPAICILKLLSRKNSGLDYMLQFKVIDEIGAIAESNAKELKKYFSQNTEENNLENTEYRNSFNKNYEETIKYIKSIDEINFHKLLIVFTFL